MSPPWLKFYGADWRSDPRLRLCSLAARGLWIELIALMQESEPYGHAILNGEALTPRRIAALAGAPEREVVKLLAELEAEGVFSRTEAKVIFSRRMVRDAERAAADKANGRKGGNPSLRTGVNPPVKPTPNPSDNRGDKAQKPEARSQNHSDPVGSVRRDELGGKPKPRQADFDLWWEAYPRKVEKLKARTAFDRAWAKVEADDPLAVMVEAAKRYAARTDPAYLKHPPVWLNAGCWADEELTVVPFAKPERPSSPTDRIATEQAEASRLAAQILERRRGNAG